MNWSAEHSRNRYSLQGWGDVEPDALRGLALLYNQLQLHSPLESYHDAAQMLDDVQRLFCKGELSLEQRALAEQCYFATLRRILPMLQPRRREHSLPLHRPKSGETYLLGFFMLGAYQEILGDIHNLFGDTDTVNLDIHADGSFSLNSPEHGDRVDELLAYVHFKPDKLRAVYRQRVQAAGLAAQQARQFLSELEAGLTAYTYHED